MAKQQNKGGKNDKLGRDSGLKARPSHRNWRARHMYHGELPKATRHLTPFEKLPQVKGKRLSTVAWDSFVNPDTGHIGMGSKTIGAMGLAEDLEWRNAAMGLKLVNSNKAVAFCQSVVRATTKPIYVIPLGLIKTKEAQDIARKNPQLRFLDEGLLRNAIRDHIEG